jgi:5-methylcytosine-specific restriction protein B
MSTSSQLSQRYAAVVQPLLKIVLDESDSRRLKGFAAVDGQFSSRTFARETVVQLADLARHLGVSTDPYVSNPLRRERLEDELLTGRGREGWESLFRVLAYIDQNPDTTYNVLVEVLRSARERPEALDDIPPSRAAPIDLATLVEQTHLDEDTLLDIIDVLTSDQPQVIFAGPPGTSKTFAAEAIASYLVDTDTRRVHVTQLHASYGYEELIEGLRPTAPDGVLRFDVERGVVRVIAETMGQDPHVLILDEMNRANLPRVLGELLYALERRGEPVNLMYTKGFKLPQGLKIIGTMNTADRSIRSVDAAVRRRFQFFEFPPNPQILDRFYADRANEVEDLVPGFIRLNDRLSAALDRHHTIGHTFFMDDRGMSATRLRRAWDRQVRPLLEEYLYDQPDRLAEFHAETLWPSISQA